MLAFTLRRILVSIPVLLVSTVVVFLLVSSTGDPLDELKHRNPPAPPESIKAREDLLHLNDSLAGRYWFWLKGLLQGDAGPSLRYFNHTGSELLHRFGVTLRMVLLAVLFALIFAVVTGVVSAVKQYSVGDYSLTFLGFLFLSLPTFWFALLLKQVAIIVNNDTGSRFFGTIGEQSVPAKHGFGPVLSDIAGHLILPTITLALISYASWSRFQRAAMLDVLNSDYIRLARAKGLSRGRVMVRHALRNALVPLTTVVAIDFAVLLGGAIITENVFQWHGMGDFGLRGIQEGDIFVVLDWLLLLAVVVIVFNLIADLLYAVLDPRIRYA